MGALGHYLERAGIPTAQISLIREQTAAIRPPRALWVPFMLGRPFGAPNDREFQRRVLMRLLRLFEAPAGPVLEDYPEEAPQDPGDAERYVCPVSFAGGPAGHDDLGAALEREMEQLAVWYEEAKRRRGRTTVGITGMAVGDSARLVGRMLRREAVEPPPGDIALGTLLKRCCDDIKAYYLEAAGAQPGQLSARQIERWFWHETAAGRAFVRLRETGLEHPDRSVVTFVERSLVPRAVAHFKP